ncbi:MAG TPA: TIGR04283 family arsenosugar biosynthesis glycosyltransferase [Noviherbaspirillum sp.]|jgi:rSAM/selenodomain-associated transferase 2|uniref:TIGR04283 family arsenosugar biosynthesis glycosyltransferase n=1 Tax=Noviherbaspirillum sp. TaxID=1926288 RepID=UPI002DDD39F6|nr:TIGR04283 family arsenosugar biosynthesis glycosyltransferase [Noviherbaspirillum sp.]HEV2612907.1 TIGR04283 family arsenosugar biosynthesis glycosyltransferase [Noviherbaspirillum sp.]
MLSIILPVLNEAEHIAASLTRLQALRADDVELIVVDGGSSDDTVRLATPLADRLVHAHRGRARQMNAGAALAKGDILLFLHADTELPRDALNAMQEVREGLASPAHAWGRFDVRIEGRSRMFVLIAALMNLRSRITGIATGDQAIFVRRDAFNAVGGFPEQPLMEDIELSRLLKSRTKPLCLREKVTTSGRRWEKYGIWRTIVLMWRLRLLYWMGIPAERLAKAYR